MTIPKKSAYFVGIKGVAMTALALFLKQKGYKVSGSDVNDHFATDDILRKEKIPIKHGFLKEHIEKTYSIVIVTGAHGGMTNIEAQTARRFGIPTYMHGEALGKFMDAQTGISVAGCHGKTTTSSLVASLLTHAGYDPSYAVGTASIADLGYPGHFGKGNYFVAESDEYVTCPLTDPTPRFLWQHPALLVITNIEYDHPDAYADLSAVKNAYFSFTKNLTKDGVIIANADDHNVSSVIKRIPNKVITYGFSPQADYQIVRFSPADGASYVRVIHKKSDLGQFSLSIAGRHNAANALAASLVAQQVGISWENIRTYLKLYRGSKRRFEKIGSVHNYLVYDDYAHHPTEIQSTLRAAKEWFPERRLIVIFQPHTFSRTKSLLSEFSRSFISADATLICDIYPSAREKKDTSISSFDIVQKANQLKQNVFYTRDEKSVMNWLKNNLLGNELIFTMGAGDLFLWHDEILKVLKDV